MDPLVLCAPIVLFMAVVVMLVGIQQIDIVLSGSEPTDTGAQQLLQFCEENGITLKGEIIWTGTATSGRVLVADRDIKKGEIIIKVPKDLVVTNKMTSPSSVTLTPTQKLALNLLIKINDTTPLSNYYSNVNVAPVIQLSESDLKCLSVRDTIEYGIYVEEMSVFKNVCKARNFTEKSAEKSLQIARQHGIQIWKDDTLGLVPAIDQMNHVSDGPVVTRNPRDWSFTVISDRSLSRGQHMALNYFSGWLSGSETIQPDLFSVFLKHSFIDEDFNRIYVNQFGCEGHLYRSGNANKELLDCAAGIAMLGSNLLPTSCNTTNSVIRQIIIFELSMVPTPSSPQCTSAIQSIQRINFLVRAVLFGAYEFYGGKPTDFLPANVLATIPGGGGFI